MLAPAAAQTLGSIKLKTTLSPAVTRRAAARA